MINPVAQRNVRGSPVRKQLKFGFRSNARRRRGPSSLRNMRQMSDRGRRSSSGFESSKRTARPRAPARGRYSPAADPPTTILLFFSLEPRVFFVRPRLSISRIAAQWPTRPPGRRFAMTKNRPVARARVGAGIRRPSV